MKGNVRKNATIACICDASETKQKLYLVEVGKIAYGKMFNVQMPI